MKARKVWRKLYFCWVRILVRYVLSGGYTRCLQTSPDSQAPLLTPEANVFSFFGCSVSPVVCSCRTFASCVLCLCSANPRHPWCTDYSFCKSDISQMCQANCECVEKFSTHTSQIFPYLEAILKKIFLVEKKIQPNNRISIHVFVQIQKASGAHWSILLFRGACSCVPLSSIIDLAQTGWTTALFSIFYCNILQKRTVLKRSALNVNLSFILDVDERCPGTNH